MIEQSRGLFIVLEGPEGGGKSSQIHLLADYLQKYNLPILTTSEPGGTKLGQRIRQVVKERDAGETMHPRTELLLFSAARNELVTSTIKPHLQMGGIVISDRFDASTFAYQVEAQGLPIEELLYITKMVVAAEDCIPDICLVLDVPPEIGLNRKGRQELDASGENPMGFYELQEKIFHEKVRAGYHKLVRMIELQQLPLSHHAVLIDAHRSKAEIHMDIVKAVDEVIANKKLVQATA